MSYVSFMWQLTGDIWIQLAHLKSWGSHRAYGQPQWCLDQTWQQRMAETVDIWTPPAPCVLTHHTSNRETMETVLGMAQAAMRKLNHRFQRRFLYLVECQNTLHFLRALLRDLQALLLWYTAVTGQTGTQQQLGSFMYLWGQNRGVRWRV